MKRFFLSMLTAVMAISMVSCEYDDSELTGRVENLEGRVQALEQLCQQMNTNISAMQAIVNALQTQDFITAVTPITEGGKTIGYTITFSKGDPITIYHGQDGKDGADGADGEDGYTPVIGVDQAEDGEYYWTLDGEWLTDSEGNKIATSGKDGADGEDGTTEKGGMPQLKIQGGYWYVSYDGGETWERLGRATGYDGQDGKDGQNGKNGDAFFEDVDDSNADYVVFELTDGTTFKVPKYKEFSVEIKPVIDYVVVGGDDLQLKYVVSNCPNPTVLVISDLQTSISDGFITVKAPTSVVGLDSTETITLLVSNGSTTVMASVDIDVAEASASSVNYVNNLVENGVTIIALAAGEYDFDSASTGGKTLTFIGSSDAVIKVNNDGEDGCDYAFGAAGTGVGNVTFNGVTIDTTGNTGNYKGFAYMKGTFNNCNFVGSYSLNNANDFVFNECTFDFKNGYFWTWGAKSVLFDGCTFNGNSKNILAHGWASTVITINNCNFAATEVGKTGAGDPTACVEIDPAETNTYTINFTGKNSKTNNYAGWTRIKDGSTGHTITGLE